MEYLTYAKQITHARKDNAVRAHFWRPERGGLTTDLDRAGIYTAKEALDIEREGPEQNVAVPLELAKGLDHCVVNYVGLETTLAGTKKS